MATAAAVLASNPEATTKLIDKSPEIIEKASNAMNNNTATLVNGVTSVISGVGKLFGIGGGMSDQEKREQARLDKALQMEIERQNKEFELKQLELKQKAQQAEREHQRELEKIKNENNQKKLESVNGMIQSYQGIVNDYVEQQKTEKIELEETKENLRLVQENMDKLKKEKEAQLKIMFAEISKHKDEFKIQHDRIVKAIDQTDVDEGNIPQFLRLINDGLLIATMANQQQSDKLAIKIKLFGDLMENECSTTLTIKTYFSDKRSLKRFIEPLQKADYVELEDLKCQNDGEYKELCDELVEFIPAENDDQKSFDKLTKSRERRMFKRCCMSDEKNGIEPQWKKDADDKQEISKIRLLDIAPTFVKFFGNINNAMNDISQLLAYSIGNLNDKQLDAVKYQDDNMQKLKEIEFKPDEIDEKKHSDDQKMDVAITENKDLTNITKTSNAINAAAIVKLHITERMQNEFTGGNFAVLRASSLTTAETVENCCVTIIRSQCLIRQSVLIAKKLIDLKPAQPNDKAQKLWDAITAGTTHIYENAMQMSKISTEYFAYFVRFKQAFEYFRSSNEIKKDVSLAVSMEQVKSTIQDFDQYKSKIDGVVDKLRISAVNTISNCIAQTAGAQQFEDAQKARDIAEKNWKEAEQKYNQFKFSTNDAYEKLRQSEATLNAKKNGQEFVVESNNEVIKQNRNYLISLRKQAAEILSN